MRFIKDDIEHKYKYYSDWYLSKFTKTRSLNKLEDLIKQEGEDRTAFVASGYIYYNKIDKLNKIKHPELYKHVQEFIKQKDKKDFSNDYSKVQISLTNKVNSYQRDIETKESVRTYIEEELNKMNLSLNYASKEFNVSYSNLYTFIKNKKYKQISINKLNDIQEVINKWKMK